MKSGNYHSQIRGDKGKPSVPAWEINLIAYAAEFISASQPGDWTPDGPTNPDAYRNLSD